MKPLMLMILDGFGIAPPSPANAVANARTPNLDRFFTQGAFVTLGASGLSVGLPDGQMGNSEVGHTNIGAGRIVYQELTRISRAVADGSFFDNPALTAAMKNCADNGTALHLCGLLSDGGVHSHDSHLFALLGMADAMGVGRVWVHALLDGRDVAPDSGAGFVRTLEGELEKHPHARIATVGGRYYGMDRDNRWERVELAWRAVARGEGVGASCAPAAVEASYAAGVYDEFVKPVVLDGYAGINDNDSFIFFNFRPDRARELTRAVADRDFDGFARPGAWTPVHFVCMTRYDAQFDFVSVAFEPDGLSNTFGQYISLLGKTQLRIAETEKYAHVTFFFNGGRETPYIGEDRILVPSPKVATYDLKPEMSAPEVTDAVTEAVKSGKYDVIVLNYANCDMVGHTGVYDAAVTAVETVDACAGRVADAVVAAGGAVLICADHGNADCMADEDGSPFTAHTLNPVPFALVGAPGYGLRSGGVLADIAPTMLALMGLDVPPEMTGRSLLEKNG